MPSTVVITGATGYVGASILSALINDPATLNVRIVLRKESQAAAFLEAYASKADRIKFYYVKSFEEEGAFDEAAAGAELFMHSACPVIFAPKDNRKDVLDPSINGLVNAMKSASKSGTIKAFCYLSSMGAVLDAEHSGGAERCYTPADKFKMTYEEAANVVVGPETPMNGVLICAASKALAEEAGREFMEREKPSFAFSTVAPGWCMGPSSKAGAKTIEEVGTTFHFMYTCLVDTPQVGPTILPQFVDVRDVGRTCVGALLHPEISANKRYLVNGGKYTNERAAVILRKLFPEQAHRIASAEDTGVDDIFSIDGTLCEKDYGFKYIGLEQTLKDYGEQLFTMAPDAPVVSAA